MQRPKILIIDDSQLCLEVASSALSSAGYEVITTTEVVGFNRLFSQTKPALVIVDVSMPALRGPDLINLLRRHQGRACPVILYSSQPRAELVRLTQSCGASCWVSKEADTGPLVAAVDAIVSKTEQSA